MPLHSPDASSAARGPRILVVVTEPSAPEPDPAEQAPQHPPGHPAKRPVEPRIGDADRDQAVAFLQEHLANGRIEASEFDDRMSQALKAKTASELSALFEDLPEPRPPSASDAAGYQAPPWQQATQRSFDGSRQRNDRSRSRLGSALRPPAPGSHITCIQQCPNAARLTLS
jgi:hypothetical protein